MLPGFSDWLPSKAKQEDAETTVSAAKLAEATSTSEGAADRAYAMQTETASVKEIRRHFPNHILTLH